MSKFVSFSIIVNIAWRSDDFSYLKNVLVCIPRCIAISFFAVLLLLNQKCLFVISSGAFQGGHQGQVPFLRVFLNLPLIIKLMVEKKYILAVYNFLELIRNILYDYKNGGKYTTKLKKLGIVILVLFVNLFSIFFSRHNTTNDC